LTVPSLCCMDRPGGVLGWPVHGTIPLRGRDVTVSACQGCTAARSRWATSSAEQSRMGEPCLHPYTCAAHQTAAVLPCGLLAPHSTSGIGIALRSFVPSTHRRGNSLSGCCAWSIKSGSPLWRGSLLSSLTHGECSIFGIRRGGRVAAPFVPTLPNVCAVLRRYRTVRVADPGAALCKLHIICLHANRSYTLDASCAIC
jgi:hypothetical protein